jgi:hypothetical protein
MHDAIPLNGEECVVSGQISATSRGAEIRDASGSGRILLDQLHRVDGARGLGKISQPRRVRPSYQTDGLRCSNNWLSGG